MKMLGEFYMREGSDPEAESSFQEALRKNSGMADSHFGIAKIYFHQGEYQEALAEADAALQIAPGARESIICGGKF
jgi:Tfp pilus assembly protein PilF